MFGHEALTQFYVMTLRIMAQSLRSQHKSRGRMINVFELIMEKYHNLQGVIG